MYVTKVKIYTDGGNWEYEVGGHICDPDEFDWEIKAIEIIVPSKQSEEIK